MSEDKFSVLKWVSACIILGIIASWAGGTFSEHTYVGEVVGYTIIEGPYLHTDLELKTYSGSSFTVQFEGTLELHTGDTIKIAIKWNPAHCFSSVTNYEIVTHVSQPMEETS